MTHPNQLCAEVEVRDDICEKRLKGYYPHESLSNEHYGPLSETLSLSLPPLRIDETGILREPKTQTSPQTPAASRHNPLRL